MRLFQKFSKRWMLALLVFGALVLAAIGPSAAGPMRTTAQYLLAPLGTPGLYLVTQARRQADHFLAGGGESAIVRENAELRWRLLQAETQLQQRLDQEARKNALYGQIADFQCELIPSKVVLADSLPYGQTRVISPSGGVPRGVRVTTRELLTDRSKALRPGLGVLSASALVGQVVESGAFTARLQLVTDSAFKIDANILRILDPTRPRKIKNLAKGVAAMEPLTAKNNRLVEVIATGDGRDFMVAADVSRNHGIAPGDWLVTRADSLMLPANVRIGQVEQVQDDPAHADLVRLLVRPATSLSDVREVYVIVPLGGKAN